MDKKQLASKIWAAANEMRGSLDANDYKDFILGFMFYKFLSDQEIAYFKELGLSDDEMEDLLVAGDHDLSQEAKRDLGYYIAFDDLFGSWLAKGNTLNVADVSEGLNRFDNNISSSKRHLYKGVFESFSSSIRKLGDNAAAQAKQLRTIMVQIKDVPTDNSQNYDVLGYIYEYLIGKFAANAGKKNGEFYTPHTVALVMAELVADHIKGRETVEIYDPTSGSGSLLLNIGSSIERRSGNKGNIRYYAQELKQDAYNITRMNLAMRGIDPANIVTRRANSLGQDWPLIDEHSNYNLLRVDAVVSNPPYSAAWDRAQSTGDPRFNYGLAPEKKADYAFLLHELYHLKEDGILTIVLPHGVLFRGGDEEKIRTNLIENNHIETIIGFPPNVFYGTGISTIVMVLKKQRDDDTTVQFVDASKGFTKAGTKNELRDRDVRKIVDTVLARADVEKYSRIVTRDEIRENGYNLNIPRYVDSAETPEHFDIYSTMFGGIPNKEIDTLSKYWDSLPGVRETLFEGVSETHSRIHGAGTRSVNTIISEHKSVQEFVQIYIDAFTGFQDELHSQLINNVGGAAINLAEADIRENIFNRLDGVPIVDKYAVYQHFADQWQVIEPDLGVIQLEGWDVIRGVEPNYVMKKQKGIEVEVQDGWTGTILPFELVQRELMTEDFEKLDYLTTRKAQLESQRDELFESVDEDDYGTGSDSITNKDGTAFALKGVTTRLKSLLQDVTSPEIEVLTEYLDLPAKQKLQHQANHSEIGWSEIGAPNKSGTYNKGAVTARISQLQSQTDFEEGSIEAVLIEAQQVLTEISVITKDIKTLTRELHEATCEAIPTLSDDQMEQLLHAKWITPLTENLRSVPGTCVSELISTVTDLAEKYSTTLTDIERTITAAQRSLAEMMDKLTSTSSSDAAGVDALTTMFGGK